MKAKTFKTVTLIMLIAVLLIGMTTIFLVGGNQAFDADAMMWGGSVANAATTLQTGAHVHKISESDENTTTFAPLTADGILALSKEEISYEDGPFLVTGNYFLDEDILLPTRRALKIAGEATVTLCLNGHKLAGNGNRTIEVKQGATFNLCDCNGSNGSHSYTEAGTGEYVFGDGAAGTVDGTVSGGVITGGNVSGVYLYVSSSYSAYTAFNMYGGTIAGNIANSTSGSSGGGVRIVGSKSYYTRTSFNMYGGTIAGNITDTIGGGVFVEYCIFNMSGGSIAKNRTYVAGGGIYASNSDVTLSGSAKIEGNRADVDNASYSGGIYFFGSDKTLTVSESAQILDNFAKSQYGSLRMDSGTLNVTGGKIAGGKTEGASATETSSDSDSGISLKGKTTVSGGVIEDNIIASGDLTVTEDAPDKAINNLFVNEKCTAYFDIAEKKANKISAMGGYFARKSTSLTCPDSYAIVELVDSGLSSKDNYYKKGYPYSVYKKQKVFLEGYQIGTPTYDGMPIKKDADFTFYGSGTPSITAWKKKDGTESGTGDSLPKNAGTYTLTVSSPASITNMSEGSRNIYYYPAIEYMFDITIAKAIVNAPSISSKEYTGDVQTASVSVKETDQYSVTENNGGTTVGNYNVVLTLVDSTNYKWTDSDEATKTIVFKITKAKAEALSAPQITEGLVYGDKLSKIVLGDGWQWVNDTTPKVSDSNKTDYEVKKEVDDDNYDWTEIKGYANGFYTTTVKVTVEKATPEYTTPGGLTAIYGQTLNDVKLLENWAWDDEVTTKVGAVGKRSFSATFTPEDTDNYKTVTIELSIDVSKATV